MGISTLSELRDAMRPLQGESNADAIARGLRDALAAKGGVLARAYAVPEGGEDHVLVAVFDDPEDDLFLYAVPETLVRDGGWEPAFDALDGRAFGHAHEASVDGWSAFMRLSAAIAMFEDLDELDAVLGEVGREYFDHAPALPGLERLAEDDACFLPYFGATTQGGPDPGRLDRRYRRVVSVRRTA